MELDNLCKGCYTLKTSEAECSNCDYQESSTQDVSIYIPQGTLLEGKYSVGNVIGQGGFGITYLGWDQNLNIKLAIKEYFPQGIVSRTPGDNTIISFAGDEKKHFEFGLDRFLKEARTLAQFENHPNIVTVRDYFKTNGTAYMIMSYIEGLTLEKYLIQQGGKLSFNKTLDIMLPVMDALKEVHSVGVMHRDISPDNILIDKMGRVIIIDFGAARQDIQDRSKSLSVILKAGYAPEEQYRSKGKQGAWTDVYAVAATMYRSLVGEVPPESIGRLVEDDLVKPSQLNVDIDQDKEQSLLKALAVQAKDRYSSIEEFQEEITDNIVVSDNVEKGEFKPCPYCGEVINAKAIKCKNCHEFFDKQKEDVAKTPDKKEISDSAEKPVMNIFVKTGSTILLLLIAWSIIINLPMLSAINLPLRFNINDIIGAVLLTIITVLLIRFGSDIKERFGIFKSQIPQLGTVITLFSYLVAVLILYFAYQPLALPYLANFAWVYHIAFLFIFLFFLVKLGQFIYQNIELFIESIVSRGGKPKDKKIVSSVKCTGCGENYLSDGRMSFCSKCGNKLSQHG